MNESAAENREVTLSPYRRFTRAEWARLRADTPLTLSVDDLTRLQSINDPISVEEVIAIYLPLSRLLALYVAATQGLFKATQRFLGAEDGGKVPYIIGVAGSVAVGKSTTARVLQAMLSRWPNTPKVQLVTTDGFLHPNAKLIADGSMDRKGFPESYDGMAVINFLAAVQARQPASDQGREPSHRGSSAAETVIGPLLPRRRATMLRPLAALAILLLAAPAFAGECGGVDLSADPAVKPDWAAHADEMVNGEG